eukprot:Awhi_evm1s4992
MWSSLFSSSPYLSERHVANSAKNNNKYGEDRRNKTALKIQSNSMSIDFHKENDSKASSMVTQSNILDEGLKKPQSLPNIFHNNPSLIDQKEKVGNQDPDQANDEENEDELFPMEKLNHLENSVVKPLSERLNVARGDDDNINLNDSITNNFEDSDNDEYVEGCATYDKIVQREFDSGTYGAVDSDNYKNQRSELKNDCNNRRINCSDDSRTSTDDVNENKIENDGEIEGNDNMTLSNIKSNNDKNNVKSKGNMNNSENDNDDSNNNNNANNNNNNSDINANSVSHSKDNKSQKSKKKTNDNQDAEIVKVSFSALNVDGSDDDAVGDVMKDDDSLLEDIVISSTRGREEDFHQLFKLYKDEKV